MKSREHNGIVVFATRKINDCTMKGVICSRLRRHIVMSNGNHATVGGSTFNIQLQKMDEESTKMKTKAIEHSIGARSTCWKNGMLSLRWGCEVESKACKKGHTVKNK